MTSVFSSIVLPKREGSKPPSETQDAYNHVHDLASTGFEDEEPSTRELNDALRVLVELFPDVQPDVFREMLTRVSPASRVEIVTEQLLKHDTEYIQGRYRRGLSKMGLKKKTKDENVGRKGHRDGREERPVLRQEEMFRADGYKQAVKTALYDEFRSLSHAAIKAVLAENNFHYTPARAALLDVASKSWRAAISNFFFRRRTPSVNTHPFLDWSSSHQKGHEVPRLRRTGNTELDHELHAAIVQPAKHREREAQCIVDNALAHQIAGKEAEDASEEYDCGVCYTTVPVHKIGICDDGGHFICFRCIAHTVTEAVYGQGWPRSLSNARATMKCVAPIMDDSGDCKGCIPFPIVELALADKEVRGESTLQKFEQRLASNTLQETTLPLAHCPFCSYAEVDDLMLSRSLKWRLRDPFGVKMLFFWLSLFLTATGGLLLLLPFLPIVWLIQQSPPFGPRNPFRSALLRLAHKSRGLRFTCRAPSCSKRSCLRCHAPWRDPHTCYSTQLSTLQKSIEAAQTAAVKRVCPKCNLSRHHRATCNSSE